MIKKVHQFINGFGLKLTKRQSKYAILIILAIFISSSYSIYSNFIYVETLSIAAGKPTGGSYKFAEKMAAIVNNRQPQIKIQVIPTDGTQENLEKLNKGEVQLAAAQADALLFEDNIKNLQSAQIVTLLFPDMYQLIVKSGINSISELEGKRIAQPPEKGGQIQSLEFLMKHYGVEPILTPVKDTDVDITKAFCQGTVDAVFHVRTIGNDSIQELLKCNGQLLQIDQAEAMRTKNPYVEEAEIPKGVYKNDNTPIPQDKLKTIRVWRLLLVREDVSSKAIQQITRILYQHRQEFVREMPMLANISPPENLTNSMDLKPTVLPTHPGAQAYYDREKPSWLQDNSGVLEVIFAILIPIISGFWWFGQQIEQARKNKADDYIREITTLMDAQDCITTVVADTNAAKLGGILTAQKISNIIVEKTAKILVEKHQAEHDRRRNLISQHSLESFSKTLRKVVNVIEKMSDDNDIRQKVFDKALEKAVELLNERIKNNYKNFFKSLLIGKIRISDLFAIQKKQEIHDIKDNLSATLEKAKTTPEKQKKLQKLSDLSSSELSQFLDFETQEIRRDLDAIFKRAVNALVEERISQDSFQSFRVIWQIAIDNANRIPKL